MELKAIMTSTVLSASLIAAASAQAGDITVVSWVARTPSLRLRLTTSPGLRKPVTKLNPKTTTVVSPKLKLRLKRVMSAGISSTLSCQTPFAVVMKAYWKPSIHRHCQMATTGLKLKKTSLRERCMSVPLPTSFGRLFSLMTNPRLKQTAQPRWLTSLI